MNKTEGHAGKTAKKQITITIKGRAYECLERLADALNEWHPGQDEPNTAETVFANFFNFDLGMLESKDPKEAIENVVDGVSCEHAETPEEERAAQKRLMAIMQRRFAA